eukprot:scaffold245_cov256-Pinguiococcus_pyrenoidosus.AAC.3
MHRIDLISKQKEPHNAEGSGYRRADDARADVCQCPPNVPVQRHDSHESAKPAELHDLRRLQHRCEEDRKASPNGPVDSSGNVSVHAASDLN